jgi:bacterioferritin
MQGDRAIIQRLNQVLTNELTSVNQYFLHARMLDNWGFKRLGKIVYDESIGEMKHADKLIKRILFLEGLPNLQDLHKLAVGETVLEALSADLALETAGRATLVEGVAQCESAADYVSREVLVDILTDTEDHIDFLETQLALAASLGEANYLQSAAGELKADLALLVRGGAGRLLRRQLAGVAADPTRWEHRRRPVRAEPAGQAGPGPCVSVDLAGGWRC